MMVADRARCVGTEEARAGRRDRRGRGPARLGRPTSPTSSSSGSPVARSTCTGTASASAAIRRSSARAARERKLYEGDHRTPTGLYTIIGDRWHERWEHFFLLDYPNADDAIATRWRWPSGDVPVRGSSHAGIGGAVGIHGTDKPWLNQTGRRLDVGLHLDRQRCRARPRHARPRRHARPDPGLSSARGRLSRSLVPARATGARRHGAATRASHRRRSARPAP